MNYSLRLSLLRIVHSLRELHRSTVRCQCGRLYRTFIDAPMIQEVETVAAAIDAEPHEPEDDEPGRFALIETD